MTTRKRKNDKDTVKDSSISAIFHKALRPESEWSDKDEFLDVVYWMRQIMGLVIGVLWGCIPLTGIVAIILFFAINAAIVFIYFNTYQKLDEEEYGGIMEVLKEGLMTSFASFLAVFGDLIWRSFASLTPDGGRSLL